VAAKRFDAANEAAFVEAVKPLMSKPVTRVDFDVGGGPEGVA